MSIRRGNSAVAASGELNNLSRVLKIGAANKATIDAGLTEAEFSAEVDRIVEFKAAKMSGVSKDEILNFKSMAARAARSYTEMAKDAALQGSKEAAGLTKKAASELLYEIELQWKGAVRPLHFTTAPAPVLIKRLKTDYIRRFEERSWKNIQSASEGGGNPSRVYVADSGANMWAYIYFKEESKLDVSIKTYPYKQWLEWNSWERGNQKDLGFDGIGMISYKNICGEIDKLIELGVKSIKEVLDVKP